MLNVNATALYPGLFQPQESLLKTVAKAGSARAYLLGHDTVHITEASSHSLHVVASARAEASEKSRAAAHKAAEVLEDAESLAMSQPAARNCTLRFLSPELHAYSFIPGDDALMLRHWLNHYVRGLRVPAAHFHFGRLECVGEERCRAWAACREELLAFGVDVSHQVSIAPSGEMYSDALRLRMVNAWLQTLPEVAWAIFADHDEFFSFSCHVESLIRQQHHSRFCASMTDRLAASGAIEPLRATPDISVQYPKACQLRQLLSKEGHGSFYTSKVALFRVWSGGHARSFRSAHNLAGTTAASCSPGASLAHYTLTTSSKRLVEAKARHELAATNRSSVGSGIVCSLLVSGRCVDYHSLLNFMLKQERTPSREVAPLCMTVLVGSTPSRYLAPRRADGSDNDDGDPVVLAGDHDDGSAVQTTSSGSTGDGDVQPQTPVEAPVEAPAKAPEDAGARASPTEDTQADVALDGLSAARLPAVRAALANRSLLSGCRGIYLDLGSTTGVVLRSLYNPEAAMHTTLQPIFSKHFGADGETRVRSVCAVAFEPNPRHTATLAAIEAHFRQQGARLTVLTTATASVLDGPTDFYPHREGTKSAPGSHLKPRAVKPLTVESVDVARWLGEALAVAAASTGAPPLVLVKMDVEGAEYALVSRLLARGVLCQLTVVLVEYHGLPEALHVDGISSAADRGQVSSSFPKVVKFVLANARDRASGCNVTLLPLNDASHG